MSDRCRKLTPFLFVYFWSKITSSLPYTENNLIKEVIHMEARKNRTLHDGQVVEVYRNLHKGADFSVRDAKTRLVVATGTGFLLINVKPKISLSGQARVRKENRKNVHCVLVGTYKGEMTLDTSEYDELYYNPYETDGFINNRTNEPITDAVGQVYFASGKAWLIN